MVSLHMLIGEEAKLKKLMKNIKTFESFVNEMYDYIDDFLVKKRQRRI